MEFMKAARDAQRLVDGDVPKEDNCMAIEWSE